MLKHRLPKGHCTDHLQGNVEGQTNTKWKTLFRDSLVLDLFCYRLVTCRESMEIYPYTSRENTLEKLG